MRSAFHCLVVVATVLACAAAVDVHLITASARSQEVATVLETKLRSRGWFKGNTAVTTAAGETAAVHAIIAGKRSGVDTVILWRPVHTSATEASEANVELAEDAGIAIVFLEAGPSSGTQQIAFSGEGVSSAAGFQGAAAQWFEGVTLNKQPGAGVATLAVPTDTLVEKRIARIQVNEYSLTVGDKVKFSLAACAGNGAQAVIGAGVDPNTIACTGGECTCGEVVKTITATSRRRFLVKPALTVAIQKLAKHYCDKANRLSRYVIAYLGANGDSTESTKYNVGSAFSSEVNAACPADGHVQAAAVFAGSDAASAEEALLDLLLKDTQVEAVIAMSDDIADGAIAAYRKAGRSKADMMITGFGFSAKGRELLDRNELLATIDEQYDRTSGGVADAVIALLNTVYVKGRQPLSGLTTETVANIVVPAYAHSLMIKRVYGDALKVRDASTGSSTKVRIGFLLIGYSVEIKTQTFKATGWFRMKWQDQRLAFSPVLERSHNVNCLKFIDSVWQPDAYMTKAVNTEVTDYYCNLDSDGTVFFSRKITFESMCPNRIENFPFDTTSCDMMIEAAGESTLDYEMLPLSPDMEWSLGPDRRGSYDEHGDELMANISAKANYVMNSTTTTSYVMYTTGNFSTLTFRFNMWRKPTFYFQTLIVPGIMLVVLSWLAMWTTTPPARASISVTTLLTNFALRSAVSNTLPASSTVSWLESFLMANLFFLFFGTVQTGLSFTSFMKITPEMRQELRIAVNARSTDRVNNDTVIVLEEIPAEGSAQGEEEIEGGRVSNDTAIVLEGNPAEGSAQSKGRRLSICDWWILYASAAENWLDVIGQVFWPLVYIFITIFMINKGFSEGAAIACSEQVTPLCGTSFFD